MRESIFTTKYYRLLLQSASSITKCDKLLLQSASGFTKCDSCYKVRRNREVTQETSYAVFYHELVY